MTRGTYVLISQLPYSMAISVGELGNLDFGAGHYGYVGSALGGLKQRVGRHMKSEKKIHWHIDHFLLRARAVDVIAAESQKKMECLVAKELSKRFKPVKGFGASDCDCESHLFYGPDLYGLQRAVLEAFKAVGLKPKRGVDFG